jgi:hypothetical protein
MSVSWPRFVVVKDTVVDRAVLDKQRVVFYSTNPESVADKCEELNRLEIQRRFGSGQIGLEIG